MTIEEKRRQVALQCKAVAHLANAIREVHADYQHMYETDAGDTILEIVGQRSAAFMETLGDMLNAMDAADDAEDWLAPVFERAQLLWPVESARTNDAVGQRSDNPI